jgi:outer membrane protein TolC
LAETLIDGGLRGATVDAARANYKATVANYRLTVLTAFQNVEDSLVSLRVLSKETRIQDQAAADAKFALKLVMNEYKAGTISYTAVIVQQNTTFTALQTASDLHGQQMTSAVSLIKALGGGWDVATLDHALG